MGAKRTRGQRAGLSRERVLEAALGLVEREGLGALTMRRLAAELDIEAMSLYHYVPNKDALLDGLVERVVERAVAARPEGGTWQEALRGYALAMRRALLAHPEVVPLLAGRPALTARTMSTVEAVLGALREAGFSPAQGLRMIHAITGLAIGEAAVQAGAGPDPLGPDAVDAEAFPLLAAAVQGGAADLNGRFEFALAALLDGFAGAARE
ncbi:TetR/AcrR family transcriptional regulator C-terminal domain-containing protein [Glycomyces sp. MUSA5-2]|uniref:TetR/AcrR family transcriptional regulator C-terminal domain-containing protein n=1 Tax=Glycomyces sp. MUSA5-2 TaxID=2053002 RepID=UPI00300A8613